MEINKMKMEIKAKEEDLLFDKLNNEKISALNLQKISFLEKEIEQWKERYNSQNKELLDYKNNMNTMKIELTKIKAENKNLKSKFDNPINSESISDKNIKSGIHNFHPNNTANSIAKEVSGSNKILIELLSGQNEIKEYLKELMTKTDNLATKNYESINKSSKYILNSSNYNSMNLSENNQNINSSPQVSKHSSNNNLIKGKSSSKKLSNNKSDKNGSFSKIIESNEEKLNINKDLKNFYPNFNTFEGNKKELKIKIINSVLKKDIMGKPYLDYICEIKNGNEIYKLNKKFGHFMMLHKALKSYFKDSLNIPNGGNLFININDMKQNSFHENKLEQLDKYISDLLNIEEIKLSFAFRNFFELDEKHEKKLA